mgnify:CR=1 FL=1
MNTLSRYTPILDKFAVSTSAICAIHCLCLPLLLVMFPALGATIFGQESFHVLLLWMVIPLSFVALTMGCRKHKSGLVVLSGLTGLTLLIGAASLGHDVLGENGERIVTLMGAIAIAFGHMRNYTLCRRMACDE